MNLGEKIMNLRKNAGYSQEELASLIGVSRQSVSKWELNDATPDLDKLLKISDLFSVSCDELLRDDKHPLRKRNDIRLSDEDVVNYLSNSRKNAPMISAAVILFILSPVFLISVGGSYSMGLFHSLFPNEETANGLSMIILFVLIAIGMALYLYAESRVSKYSNYETTPVSLSNSMYRYVEKEYKLQEKKTSIQKAIGILLIILSVIPLFAGYMAENLAAVGLGIMLIVVALGVGLLVYAEQIQDPCLILLQRESYSISRKEMKRKMSWLPGMYWLIVTAFYLIISFITDAWEKTWIVMAAAGIFYAALIIFLKRKLSDSE
ncbi:helix-turn-helix domain-containing protein [Ileibacterium valens]|uniref:HTH cro/C1-type domain-containing protein n=2 Tax=Ileibacterium valens TaxID=1862668 RepID=A0A1U7NCX4_9FIRM|nr:helix-turn-helix transcriptional regulator [Ileibacterium valens]OLU36555.1 hypothetical protein BO222_12230 [Ileibacterium valens]OLU36889.1 hypothetical protein BO224_11725 [Erysipelotrichaceae bacterium NYU-BL-E8]OLU39625.1 hypothetical protein BM735_07195 [Erysipelotrichaceae bacterium NYU-BL-F16]